MKFGYARISTPKQSLENQIANLEQAGCERIYSDVISGSRDKRPGFEKLIENLRRGDTVTVTSLDRLGRSNRFLLPLIDKWNKNKINLHIISHDLDTTTPNGKFLFDIMAALAEQERNVIRERIQRGIEGARARGRKGGRPSKLDKNKQERLKKLYNDKKLTIAEICLMYGICKPTLYNYLKR